MESRGWVGEVRCGAPTILVKVRQRGTQVLYPIPCQILDNVQGGNQRCAWCTHSTEGGLLQSLILGLGLDG